MASFTYTAIDGMGKKLNGFIDADSRTAAMDAVIARGLSPINVQEKAGAKKTTIDYSNRAPSKIKLPAAAVESFTREMANLLAAGLPLARALSLLKREAHNPAAKHVWTSIHDSVVGGKPLAEALAEWPRAFSTVYVAMVRA